MLTARMRRVTEMRGVHSRSGPRRSLLGKSVAGAIERIDRVEIGRHFPELAAQALDVAVDGAVIDIDVVLIGRVP